LLPVLQLGPPMPISIKKIGHHQQQDVLEATLRSHEGVQVKIMSYGAIVRDWRVPVQNEDRSVVLGFPDFESYLEDSIHLGAIVGRVANRISGATFSIGPKTYPLPANVGTDHLHGGPEGLSKKNWQLTADENSNSIILDLHSPDREMGYPGRVDFRVVYTLTGYKLRIEMTAQVSELTPISMVQHNYFNLAGTGTVQDHRLQIHADRYTPLNDRLLPTGELKSVENSYYDFRQLRTMADPDGELLPYDINFAFYSNLEKSQDAAKALAPDGSLTLRLWTDQPGVQLYNGAKRGFCLEDQMFPDALHHDHFPSILVGPEKAYSHCCEIEIKP
jgi:aldose 1-epimerase